MNRRLGVLLAFAALLMAVVGACGGDSEREPRSGPASPAGAPQLDAASSEPAPTVPPPVPTAVPASQGSDDGGGGKAQLALPAQNRIIVHTARMSLVVDDVALTVDSIADVASDLGGWVVSSDRSSRHSGAIAIRVPAALVDEAFRRLEALALKVDSRAVTSEDVYRRVRRQPVPVGQPTGHRGTTAVFPGPGWERGRGPARPERGFRPATAD